MANHTLSPTLDPVQPYNLDAERAVLGSCLLDREAIVTVCGRLATDDFMVDAHKHIFRSISDLWERRIPADLILVIDDLRSKGLIEIVGWEDYVSSLIVETPTAVHANYYADVVRDDSEKRRFLAAANTIATAGYTHALPADELRSIAEAAVRNAPRGIVQRAKSARELADEWFAIDEDARAGAGIRVGIRHLDSKTGGFQPGQLVVIAARTAIGKTSLALQMMHNLAKQRHNVMMYSLEMLSSDLTERMVGINTGLNMAEYRTNADYRNVHRGTATDALARLAEMPYRILEHYHGKAESLITGIHEQHALEQCQCVIVDHLQLLKIASRTQNRALEVGDITRSLKTLALELGIVVILLSQLNREVDHRSGEHAYPKLSDLKDSGSIEQDADVVLFLHRNDDLAAETWFGVAKNRQGPIGTFNMHFKPACTTFFEMDYRP